MDLIDRKNIGLCLTKLVGFKGCDNDLEVLAYVNDEYGITEQLVADVTVYSQDHSFIENVERIKRNAYQNVVRSLEGKNGLGNGKVFNRYLTQTEMPQVGVPQVPILPSDRWIGVRVKLRNNRDAGIRLNYLYLASLSAGQTTLAVFELRTGQQIHNETIDVRKGINVYDIDKEWAVSFAGEDVFVAVAQNDLTLMQFNCSELTTGCGCGCGAFLDEFAPFAINACDAISPNEGYSPTVSGVCIDAVLTCNLDSLICRMEVRNELVHLYQIAFAVELWKFTMVSPNLNWSTHHYNPIFIREDILPMAEKEYYKRLALAVRRIETLTHDSICWKCDPLQTGQIRQGWVA